MNTVAVGRCNIKVNPNGYLAPYLLNLDLRVKPHLGTGPARVQPAPRALAACVKPQGGPSPPRARATVHITTLYYSPGP